MKTNLNIKKYSETNMDFKKFLSYFLQIDCTTNKDLFLNFEKYISNIISKKKKENVFDELFNSLMIIIEEFSGIFINLILILPKK